MAPLPLSGRILDLGPWMCGVFHPSLPLVATAQPDGETGSRIELQWFDEGRVETIAIVSDRVSTLVWVGRYLAYFSLSDGSCLGIVDAEVGGLLDRYVPPMGASAHRWLATKVPPHGGAWCAFFGEGKREQGRVELIPGDGGVEVRELPYAGVFGLVRPDGGARVVVTHKGDRLDPRQVVEVYTEAGLQRLAAPPAKADCCAVGWLDRTSVLFSASNDMRHSLPCELWRLHVEDGDFTPLTLEGGPYGYHWQSEFSPSRRRVSLSFVEILEGASPLTFALFVREAADWTPVFAIGGLTYEAAESHAWLDEETLVAAGVLGARGARYWQVSVLGLSGRRRDYDWSPSAGADPLHFYVAAGKRLVFPLSLEPSRYYFVTDPLGL